MSNKIKKTVVTQMLKDREFNKFANRVAAHFGKTKLPVVTILFLYSEYSRQIENTEVRVKKSVKLI